jgi:predicted transcriptional regulator
MLRTTVYLDEETARALRRLAEAERRSQAEIVRAALRQFLQRAEQELARPTPAGVGRYRSGRRDVSANAERLLREAAGSRR